MTVFELRAMLAEMDDDALVLIFDTPRYGVTGTLVVNCVLSMNHGAPVVILEHDADEAERLAEVSTYQRTQAILTEAVREASARPVEWPGQICPSCGVAFGMHKQGCAALGLSGNQKRSDPEAASESSREAPILENLNPKGKES